MKKYFSIIAILICSCAPHFGHRWSAGDTARQVVFTGLVAYDLMVQTPDYLDDGTEQNPVIESLGKENLIFYAIGSVALHTVIGAALDPFYRRMWQYGWIVGEGATIYHNWRVE